MSSLYSLDHGWLEVLLQISADIGRDAVSESGRAAETGLSSYAARNMSAAFNLIRTAELMRQSVRELSPLVKSIASLILSGSGSSEPAGDCVRMVLQKELRVNTQAISGGTLSRTAAKPSRSTDLD